MSRLGILASLFVLPILAACGQGGTIAPPSPEAQALTAAVEARLGGTDTCVVIADTASGAVRFQYGRYEACARQLPPCSTFKIANSLIGLDAGLVTPTTIYRWDGSPQPVSVWERDADMTTAFQRSIVWWYQRLAVQVGAERYRTTLKALGYGSADPKGPLTTFWLGPKVGGGLTISARQQVDFLHRLYAGRLPVKPQSAAAVQAMMVQSEAGGLRVSGKTGSCATTADGRRSVGWWVGRIKAPGKDLVIAASMEGEQALPGAEVQDRVLNALADADYTSPP